MHEFSIIQNIISLLEVVAKENNLKSIKKVTLNVGKLRQVVFETLHFAFQTLAEKTVAFGAELAIIETPIKVLCQNCERDFLVDDNIYICPHCGEGDLKILSGKEIILDNVEGTK